MIEIKNISKSFDTKKVIEDISFTVNNSSIYGLIGYNGAGKTTLLKIAAGVITADNGAVLLDGENSFNNNSNRKDLFFLSDDLYTPSNCNLKKTAKYYSAYFEKFSFKTFDKLVKLFELPTDKPIRSFSKGMKRQAEIILALSAHPKYLLLDECFDGVDPAKRLLIKNLFFDYIADYEASIIISSHNLAELADLCDHIGLINKNHLVLDIDKDNLDTKFRLISVKFDRNISENDFKHLENIKLVSDNNSAVIKTFDHADETEEKIKAMSPTHFQSTNMSLEEIFISQMEENKYDYSEIFQ